MANSKDVERIYTQIVLGIPKSESTVTLDDELSDIWDKIAAEVDAMREAGQGFEIPAETPDVEVPSPTDEVSE